MKRSWTGIPELKESYRTLGPGKFWLTMSGTLAYIGLGTWLAIEAIWPDGYHCNGRGCLISNYWHSASLLSGGAVEISLFVWLWSMPTLLAGTWIYVALKKRKNRTFL